MPVPWIEPDEPLPPVSQALADPNGLLAAGRDLSPRRLVEAYTRGIFPWYSAGQPVLWWSPDPRMVLPLAEFRITRSFAKILRRHRELGDWTVSTDTDFAAVMRACAQPRPDQDGTWITDEIVAAYGGLHRAGLAHSVEVRENGRLIGGLYGVALGRMFYGESMFSRATDASKVALAALVQALRSADFTVIDCQQNTRHLASLGAREIPREAFVEMIAPLTRLPAPDWTELRFEVPQP